MARLIFHSADGQERTFELAGPLKVGRAADNDVVLSDPAVAEHQCRLMADAEDKVWMEPSAGGTARSEVLPGSELVFGAWKARLERRLTLEVRSEGALRGQAFPISKDRLVVGSGPTSDLCLAHESVSARHAQLSRIGGRLNLLDLGSTEGSFVNGERVSSATFTETDTLRFGSVELAFRGVSSAQPEAQAAPLAPEVPAATPAAHDTPARPVAPPRKSRAGVLLVAGGVALAALTFFVESIPGPPPPVQPAEPQRVRKFDPNRHLTDCTSLCTPPAPPFDAPACVKTCGDLLEADPSFGGMDAAGRAELLAPGYVAQAAELLSTSKFEQALPLLLLVRPGSPSFAKAKELYEKAAPLAAAEHLKECRTVVAGGLYDQALNGSCLRVLELTCGLPAGPDRGALIRLHHAARGLGRARAAWTCPANPFTQPFDASSAGDGGDPGETLIRDRYPNPRLGDILVDYYRSGDATAALGSLRLFDADFNTTERLAAKDLAKYLEAVQMRSGLHGASNLMFVEQVRQAESRFLPLGLNSPLVRNPDKVEGPAKPVQPVGDERKCAGFKAAYARTKPGSKDRQRTLGYARNAGCEAFLTQTQVQR